jgi:hypothetical protein
VRAICRVLARIPLGRRMIRISELAAEALHDSLIASGLDRAKTMRLKQDGSKFRLHLDVPGMRDRIVEHHGLVIMLIDLRLERKIGDALIDVDAEADDLRLVIRLATHPRVAKGCLWSTMGVGPILGQSGQTMG